MFGWWQTEIQWINSLKREGVGGEGKIEWFVLLNNYAENSAPYLPSQERSVDEKWEWTQAAVGHVCGVGECGSSGARQSDTETFLPPRHVVATAGRDSSVLGQHWPCSRGRAEPDPAANPRVGGGCTWSATWTKDLGTLLSFPHSDPEQEWGMMWPNPSHWPRGKEPSL